jgi:hypothetical protein
MRVACFQGASEEGFVRLARFSEFASAPSDVGVVGVDTLHGLNLMNPLPGTQRRGKKALVLDPKLSGPLSLVAQTSLLKVGDC